MNQWYTNLYSLATLIKTFSILIPYTCIYICNFSVLISEPISLLHDESFQNLKYFSCWTKAQLIHTSKILILSINSNAKIVYTFFAMFPFQPANLKDLLISNIERLHVNVLLSVREVSIYPLNLCIINFELSKEC